jgi:hypothetical protein
LMVLGNVINKLSEGSKQSYIIFCICLVWTWFQFYSWRK